MKIQSDGNGYRKFLVIWTGQLVSNIGSGMTAFCLGVYVWQLTRSALAVGLVETATLLPLILLAPATGVLADRFDRRLLMIVGDSASACALGVLLVIMATGPAALWQICLCTGFGSAFAALLDPAYKATVSDLVPEEAYARASGMVSVASSARFLISPVIGGLLLAAFNIQVILIIDILTFFCTVMAAASVRKSLGTTAARGKELRFFLDLREGWRIIIDSKGVLPLTVLVSVLVFYMGFLQVLVKPMILSFAGEKTTGVVVSVIASGMLLSSLAIGIGILKKNYVSVLSASFIIAGFAMTGMGATTRLPVIILTGFVFFASLPFANTCIDVLIRTSIAGENQGRVWGLISLISQLGYIAAYLVSGLLSDRIFVPALEDGGALAGTVGRIIGTGGGRGIGLLVMLSGLGLAAASPLVSKSRSIRQMEAIDGK